MSTEINCPFCLGTGKDPFNLLSKFSQCQVCNGLGVVEIDEPFRECVFVPVPEKSAGSKGSLYCLQR